MQQVENESDKHVILGYEDDYEGKIKRSKLQDVKKFTIVNNDELFLYDRKL